MNISNYIVTEKIRALNILWHDVILGLLYIVTRIVYTFNVYLQGIQS